MKKTIEISEELYAQIAAHCESTGKNVEAFVSEAVNAALPADKQTPVYQSQDEEEIKERLKSLGYID
jgi:negative regulator of replication initiation